MITKIKDYVKNNKDDIFLIIIFILLSLLFFAFGYITAVILNREPLIIEDSNNL